MTPASKNRPRKSTCPYCGVGCGVLVTPLGDGGAVVTGDPDHPANFGKLCSKGSALAETLGLEDRLLEPAIGGKPASWNEALDKIAAGFADAIEEHGSDSVAFYVSGQLLTEDYYVANKLMKGYIGSANIDTNSRLCMASSVVGHKRAFGADIVPGCYEDLEQADLIVLTGSNLAWCHPILYQRILKAKAERPEMKLVVIDPRETASCDQADLHLPLAPGSDVSLFRGLFKYLNDGGFAELDFISKYTENFAAAEADASTFDIAKVAELTKLSADLVSEFYQLLAATPKLVTIYSQGVNQAVDGTDKVNAIINTHLLTGRIGKPGAGPFSITGQPNAMGGREVGGLANQLATHMDIQNPEHGDRVQRYWQSPKMAEKAGLMAVDLFNAIDTGDVKAVWIMATNPVDSLPNADFVKTALQKCDLVVVSDIYGHTDTVLSADIVLPSTGWSEKNGTVSNSERRISRQPAVLAAPGQAKHDWWQICEVAKRLGFETGFSFESPAEIFKEYAGLCAFENDGTRDLDLSGLSDLTDKEYDALAPIQWPVKRGHSKGTARFFEDHKYFTKSGKAQFIAPDASTPIETSQAYPFILNTGRIRDQWHTMTRTGRTQRLSQHISEPFVEIHPEDGLSLGLGDADIATLKSPYGQMQARVSVSTRQKRGSVFTPIHFTDRFTSAGRVDSLVHPIVDKYSGQPASKSTAVSVQIYPAAWYGFAVVAAPIFEAVSVPAAASYWTKSRVDAGIRLELAGLETPANWPNFMSGLLDGCDDVEILEMSSAINGQTRMACFKDSQVVALFYTATTPVAVSRDWASSQLLTKPDGAQRHRLLAGRPSADMPDKGAIICSCMNVGINEIHAAVAQGCATLDEIGTCTTAGTNCGSCQSEIRALLKARELIDA